MAYTNTDYSFWTNPKVRAAGKDAKVEFTMAARKFMEDLGQQALAI